MKHFPYVREIVHGFHTEHEGKSMNFNNRHENREMFHVLFMVLREKNNHEQLPVLP
jgi:hypothetical protein